MAKATPAELKELSPEFTSIDDATAQLWLDIAADIINEGGWSSGFKNAHRLLAAHLFTLGARGGAGSAGPVTGVKVGEVSINYGATPGEQEALGSTTWGEMYLQLRRAVIISPIVI